MAIKYFKEHGIAYTEKDISSDAQAFDYVLNTIGQAVTPIITVGDEIVVGFDRPKLDKLLIPHIPLNN
jgi:glutaredoxin